MTQVTITFRKHSRGTLVISDALVVVFDNPFLRISTGNAKYRFLYTEILSVKEEEITPPSTNPFSDAFSNEFDKAE